jgi:predicted acetyltransferase
MRYHSINQLEIPLVADIQARAFRRNAQAYLESYREGGRVDWQALRLLENDHGQAVAAMTLFSRTMSLNGGELEAGLVGSVAVPPEQRRRGFARRLMTDGLKELRAQKTPISLLFPFSVAWYRRLGYGVANFNWHFELSPRLFPDHEERMAVRQAGPDDAPGMRACYNRARGFARNNGWLSRGDWEWQQRLWLPDHEIVVFEEDGRIQGYLVYELTWEPGDSVAKVLEWVSTSETAWRGLLAFLGALGEQVRTIIITVRPGSSLLAALSEPYDREDKPVEFVFYRTAQLISGFMLRVVHLAEALQQRRYPHHVTVDLALAVDDRQLPANSAPCHVHIERGAAVVVPQQQDAGRLGKGVGFLPQVVTDMATFSELYAGVTSAKQARMAGRLQADDTACAALTAAFATAPLYMWPADWF